MAAPVYESLGTPYAGSATSTGSGGFALGKPAGTVSGDLLIAFVAYDNTTDLDTIPSGFTSIANLDNGCGMQAFWKAAGGSEPASYTFGFPFNRPTVGFIVRASGADTTSPIDVQGSDIFFSSADPVAPSITTTDADRLVFAFYNAEDNGSEAINSYPGGYASITSLADGGSNIFAGAAYKTQASAGASGTATFDLSGCGPRSIALHFAIKPAAGGGGVSQELTGNSSTSAVGTLGVSAEANVIVTPTGVAGSSAVGTLGVTAEINASAELSGIAATSSVGTLVAEVGGGTTAALSGVTGTSAAGTLSAAGQVNAFVDLLGNSATCAAGTLIVVTGLQVALSGNAATGAVGTLGVTAEVNASATLTGVGSSGAVGTLEVTVPITASVELTGVGATGAIGTLTAVGAGQIWTEVPATSTTWTEIS